MERISKAGIAFRGLAESLKILLRAWHPAALKTEVAYRDALAEYLRMGLPETARIEREYRHQGTTCDVCVLYRGMFSEDQVLFEIKRNLKKKADYDRLVGQVEGLRPKKNTICVVLVGDTDPALLGRLRDQFRSYLDNTDFTIEVVG